MDTEAKPVIEALKAAEDKKVESERSIYRSLATDFWVDK